MKSSREKNAGPVGCGSGDIIGALSEEYISTSLHQGKSIPRYDGELENRVLSGILNSDTLPEGVDRCWFSRPESKQIFRAMKEIFDKGEKPDVFTLCDKLPKHKDLLFEIEKLGVFGTFMDDYIQKLHGLFKNRTAIEIFAGSLNQLLENEPVDEIIPRVFERFEELKAGPKRKGLVTQAVGEWLKAEIPAPIAILPGCFDAGTKADVGGGSKLRKSWFVLMMAICLASGHDFLGFRLNGDKRKVVLFNLEISEYHFRKRLQRVMDGLGVTLDEIAENLTIVNCRGQKADFPAITATVIAIKPDLIILDPFYKLVDGDENRSDTYKPILAQIDIIIAKTGAAVLKVVHYAKGFAGDKSTIDRFSGSGILARDYDVSFNLTAHDEGEDLAVLEIINRNYPPRPKETIFFDAQRCVFVTDSRMPVEKTRQNPRTGSTRNKDTQTQIGYKLPDILATPLPKTTFICRLRDEGLSADWARAYCDELLAEGTLEQLSIPQENNVKKIGYPGAIARLKEEVKKV